MPEGDTIHYAANQIRAVLEGRVPEELRTPQHRHSLERWPERLAGRAVRSVDAHGKHLFLRFEGELVLHSHLRMTGLWRVYDRGEPWGRSPRRAWLVLAADGREVVEFDGPVLELLTELRVRGDQQLAALGPDVLAPNFDGDRVLRRLREDDPTRPIGDSLLDQRIVAGLGNLWKAESCFAAGIDPWRPAGGVPDADVLAILAFARERMSQSAQDGYEARPRAVFGRAGEPCPRCGTTIVTSGQWENNRTTFWCRGCQH
ncbi:MAG TPA: DNA-formamidopyrimidine glycosylase family protein [Solirubrobacteraceae bacterium]|jgi:endonuclease-8|nr:DNA-formamidopyrimidine glycosylase family protein [Solirubrobacteraceae bacterium]